MLIQMRLCSLILKNLLDADSYVDVLADLRGTC